MLSYVLVIVEFQLVFVLKSVNPNWNIILWSRQLRSTVLLVFRVTQFKMNQNQNQNRSCNRWSPESGKWKKVNMQRISANFLVTAIFLMRDMRRNFLPKFIEICMETPCWCPSVWAPTWQPETNRNICHWVLLQKREFIPRGTLKH